MTLDAGLLAVGALGVFAVFASAAIRHLPLSEPLIAMLLGVFLGPQVLGVADFGDGIELLHTVSEVIIAIALMAVALRFPWSTYAGLRRPVSWLLTVGMLAMAAIVAGLAFLLLGVGFGVAVLLGGALAPTDPVLSSSVVAGRPAEQALPERMRVLLSEESGFNDGLALPLVMAGIVLVDDLGLGRFIVDGLGSVVIAVVLGAAIGLGAGWAFRLLDDNLDIEHSAFFVFTIVLALFVLGSVNLAGGDGILAVFVAGLAYNRQVGKRVYSDERAVEEGINRVLVLPVFVLFGAVLPWSDWIHLGWPVVGFALGVLLFRRLPVILLLRPALSFDWREAWFYGWFGPMGVAAMFFVTLALEEGVVHEAAWPTVALVVAASTVAHGVTAAPGRHIYHQSAAPAD